MSNGKGNAFERTTDLAAGLFAHQVEGIAFLLSRRRAVLDDDMGLGETRQSILAMRHAPTANTHLIGSLAYPCRPGGTGA